MYKICDIGEHEMNESRNKLLNIYKKNNDMNEKRRNKLR